MFGNVAIRETGAKSLIGSKASFGFRTLRMAGSGADSGEEGIAVARRACDLGGADRAGRSRHVFDHHRLLPRRAQPLRRRARDDVSGAAGREWHHDPHGPLGIGRGRGLRLGARLSRVCRDEESGGKDGEMGRLHRMVLRYDRKTSVHRSELDLIARFGAKPSSALLLPPVWAINAGMPASGILVPRFRRDDGGVSLA
jgi:hypothetical protein